MADRPAQSFFARAARAGAEAVGHPLAFIVSAVAVIGWAAVGPLVEFSDTWQLAINTTTTIITFLMVFLIQNTQNRDATAMHLKLDELIRSTRGAQNVAIDMEELPEQELRELRDRYQALAARARGRAERELRTGSPDLDTIESTLEVAADASADAQTVDVLKRAHADDRDGEDAANAPRSER
ncbi:MAG: low affinity iron permease family protein [Dehalococcoidia bacterium]